jgi:hypothetical protein
LSDCADYWQDIPANIQQAVKDLGFTQALWDNSLQPEEMSKWWQDSSASQWNAIERHGYHQMGVAPAPEHWQINKRQMSIGPNLF